MQSNEVFCTGGGISDHDDYVSRHVLITVPANVLIGAEERRMYENVTV